MRGRSGFTLIEIVVVVMIIGILAAIAIPRFNSSKERAQLAAIRSDLRNLVSAQESYHSERLAYTQTAASLAWNPSPGVTVTIGAADSSGWNATASHNATSRTCALFLGTAAPPAGTSVAGEVACP